MARLSVRRPSPALVIALVALVAALSSGAYAAISGIPDAQGVFHGCVNAKTGAMRVVKGARSCHRARAIRRGGRRVVIPGELAIAWNQMGPRGPQGAQGSPGTNGANGTNGTNSATNVVARTTTVNNVNGSGGSSIQNVKCNPGERATGGGVTLSGVGTNTLVNASYPTVSGSQASAGQTPDGWESGITNNTAVPFTATHYAICASP
jgi:hypothetical protein